MKTIIFSIILLSFCTFSCNKKEVSANLAATQYMSLTVGSTWDYQLTNNLTATTANYTLTSTNKDSAFNGKNYHIITNSSSNANEYYAVNASDYYNFRNLPVSLGGGNVEINYLKSEALLGASWSQTFPVTIAGLASMVTLTNTITEKNVTKIVSGIAYNDVIHVTTTMAVTVSGIVLPASAIVTDIQAYYTGKIGLIQSVNKININYSGVIDNTDQQTILRSANIK